jgi:hypothetical protein
MDSIRLLVEGEPYDPRTALRSIANMAARQGLLVVPVDKQGAPLPADQIRLTTFVEFQGDRATMGQGTTLADLSRKSFRELWEMVGREWTLAVIILRMLAKVGGRFKDAAPEELLATDLAELGLDNSTYNLLVLAGIASIAFLSFWTEQELDDIGDVGTKRIIHIRGKLKEVDKKLYGSPST